MLLLMVVVGLFAVIGIPFYIIGRRRNVRGSGVAFIPGVGATIVLLWSMDRSGWMVLLGMVPIIGVFFTIWLLFEMPANHGRTRWWGLALFMPLVGWYAYAFTLPYDEPAHAAVAAYPAPPR
jgi:hypothetical protein